MSQVEFHGGSDDRKPGRRARLGTVAKTAALLLITCGVVAIGSAGSSPGGWPTRAASPGVTADIMVDSPERMASSVTYPADRTMAEGDWPMAGANPQRTSWTSEEVRGDLSPIWYRPIEPYISRKVQIIAALDTLYVSTARGLYALSVVDIDGDGVGGEVKWVYPTELPLGHSPTIHNGVAYLGGFDHRIHAIDADPNLTTLPVDPVTGLRINDKVRWVFSEAAAGFQTNPLIIDNTIDPAVPVGEGKLFAGNRDGNLYAIYIEGPDEGSLAWSFSTGGPILFSAAYKDGVVYIASNDSHAYALNEADGTRVWKSAKLPGAGFHSWWPVVYTDPQTQKDYVIFAGSNNYRFWVEPGPLYDIQQLEIDDLYVGNGIELGDTIAPVAQDGTMAATSILEYYEQKPWRRTYFILDAATGNELTFSYERRDGATGTGYAPITWLNTHGPGNRYPPVVGSNGLLYQPMHYVYHNPWIAWGGIVGWQLGSSSISTTGHNEAMDEPVAYSAGGDLIYWVRSYDEMAGAFDPTVSPSEPEWERSWEYFSYNLPSLIPGYDQLYSSPCSERWYVGAHGSVNGIYGRGGEQNPPVPYQGKVFMHRSNAIIAFGDYSGLPTALPAAPAVDVNSAQLTPRSTEQLKQVLSQEVQEILDAGHLRPGFLGSGLFDNHTESEVGDYILDYWHQSSDTLYALLQAMPHLPASQQISVKDYLQQEFASYPPHQYTHIGWRDGAAREVFGLPPEVESDLVDFSPMTTQWDYSGWDFPPHTFYALWKYAQVMGGEAEIFASSSSRLEAAPPDDYLIDNPQVHNAYIAGYWGYLELEELAGHPESSAIRSELDRLLTLRVTHFSKDSPLSCGEFGRELNVARNFMYLVPELGQYLHDHALDAVEQAVNEYDYVAPYWFVTKTEQTRGEGVIQPLYDSSAILQAKALILQESREELLKYLDVPAFARGDLFYIQNLAAAIGAEPTLEKAVTSRTAYLGDIITYTLSLSGEGLALTLTDTLPAGESGPLTYVLEGTDELPVYNAGEHAFIWTDTPAAGQGVKISYAVNITTSEPEALVNTVDLRDEDGRTSTATVVIIANPYRAFLAAVFKRSQP